MAHRSAGEATLVAALLALLAAAIVYPLLQVLSVAFLDGGVPTLRPLAAFFARPLFREAFVNTLLAGVLAVVIGSVIAVPLALLTVRYRFPGRTLVTVLGVLPLVIPPFVGAVAFQQILGRSGAVNLLLREHAGFTIPFMEGLTGVVLVQSLHYFPFILLNTAAALAGLDRSLEEAAQNLGSSGWRLFRRVAAAAGPAGLRGGRPADVHPRDRRPGHAADAQLHQAARAAGLRAGDHDRAHRRGRLRDLRDPGGAVARGARAVQGGPGPRRVRGARPGRRGAAGGAGPARRAGGVGARRAAAGAGAAPARGHPAAVGLEGVEPHAAAERLHPRQLRGDPGPLAPVHRQHDPLRGARRAARRGAGRGDRVAPAPRPGARAGSGSTRSRRCRSRSPAW